MLCERIMSFGQRKTILIYEDYGCADITILLNELKTYFEPRGYTVGLTNAVGIIRGHELNESILAFFMPGGADTPYRQKLAVQGNHLIRNYVKSGGIYYGICAGAYYACRQTIFEKNIPALKVIHQCGLNLIDGKAIGTLYKELNISPFDKNMMSSAAVEVIWNDGQKYIVHYHGGPYFKLSNKKKIDILAYYNLPHKKPAIISCSYGTGKVIVSGVHFEDSGQALSHIFQKLSFQFKPAQHVAHQLTASEQKRRALFERIMSLSHT